MNRFADKLVLITGAARGQGAEEARRWVAGGGRVVIADVADEPGEALARELGPKARYIHLDVSREGHWIEAMDVVRHEGGLHGLVNNAAIFEPRPMDETSLASFERHVQVNQLGCFLGMKHAAELMKGNDGGGSIVNISSSAGMRGTPGAFAYSATKWAVRGMSRAASISLARRNIRVNSVYPGPIDTDMVKFRSNEEAEKRLSRVPMRRMGTSGEVAAVVIFLLSDDSAYMTGAEITVDGGATL